MKTKEQLAENDKPRPFLTYPAVIDWLQWVEFPERIDKPNMPQVTLNLIHEYRARIKELEDNIKKLNQSLNEKTLSRWSAEQAIARAEKYKKALEKYADRNNWRYCSNQDVGAHDAWLDFKPDHACKTYDQLGGFIAREALKDEK